MPTEESEAKNVHEAGVTGQEPHNRSIDEGDSISWRQDRDGRMVVTTTTDGVESEAQMDFEHDIRPTEPVPTTPEIPPDVVEELAELRDKWNRFEPAAAYIDRHGDKFRQHIQEQLDTGELDASENPYPPPEPPSVQDIAEYNKIRRDPAFEEIHDLVQQYASTRPDHERELLDVNHREYSKLWKAFRAEAGSSVGRSSTSQRPYVPQQQEEQSTPDGTWARIQAKEVLKGQARLSTNPGIPHDLPTSREQRAKTQLAKVQRLKDLRNELPISKSDDIDFALARALYSESID